MKMEFRRKFEIEWIMAKGRAEGTKSMGGN
jgi:hypothetical protein